MNSKQKKPKKVTQKYVPRPTKKPQYKKSEVLFAEEKLLSWRFSLADKNGSFSWERLLDDGNEYKRVLKRLREFEEFNHAELPKHGCHSVKIDNLSTKAKSRLVELELDDIDVLYSLRINGTERVYCILDINIMKILWWDPDHEVYPSHKKHT